MSLTWTQFREAAIAAYNPGAQGTAREAAAIEAVALFVKSKIVREVDSDLERAKSYLNSYIDAKLKLAGYTITSNFTTVKASVIIRLTNDGTRLPLSAASGYNDLAIQEAIDDFNGTATMFDQLLITAAVEIQRHAPGYQSNQVSTYKKGDPTVTIDGFVSKVTFSEQGIIRAIWYGTRYNALAGNTAYAADDLVQSNGRVYKCVTAGTSANPIGAGLTSTDGEDETTGTAVFQYYAPLDYDQMRNVPWWDRFRLQQDEPCTTGLCTIKKGGSEFWVYPALDDDHDIKVEWDGLKTTFSGSDATTFDQPCAQYAAQFIRGMLQKDILDDPRAANASLATASAMLKRLWMDSSSRS
jgi:hypothetical protein